MTPPALNVSRVDDFDITGDGSYASWSAVEWTPLGRYRGETPYETRFKALYSATGLYVLLHCVDQMPLDRVEHVAVEVAALFVRARLEAAAQAGRVLQKLNAQRLKKRVRVAPVMPA